MLTPVSYLPPYASVWFSSIAGLGEWEGLWSDSTLAISEVAEVLGQLRHDAESTNRHFLFFGININHIMS